MNPDQIEREAMDENNFQPTDERCSRCHARVVREIVGRCQCHKCPHGCFESWEPLEAATGEKEAA